MRYTKMREWLSRMQRDQRSRRDRYDGRDYRDYNDGRDYRDYNDGRDMRNPYGSRGGYVRSDRARGRDNDYSRMGDMARDREYDGRDYNRDYNDSSNQMDGRDYQYDRQFDRDSARRVGYFDYNDDYNYDSRRDYGDMARRRDYHSEDYKLTPKEIRKWSKELDGKFTTEQVEQIARQIGIKFDEFEPELLTVIANMMASDYGKATNVDMMTAIKMAKAFLCDEDFDGTPEEKAYLYYTAIVEKED